LGPISLTGGPAENDAHPRTSNDRLEGPKPPRAYRSSLFATGNEAPGSFGQPRFPKALNDQLRGLRAPSDPQSYRKARIGLKKTSRRLTRLSVTSEMGKIGGETLVSRRKGGVPTKSLLRCSDGLLETTEFNQAQPHNIEPLK
jgi:hypothetical protein